MIRPATEADIPAILSIYAHYVLNTTYSFEYTVPTEEEFRLRFRSITAQYPWLVWEEEGQVLGYAYGSAPSPGLPTPGAPSLPSIWPPRPRDRASAGNSMPF